LGSIASVLHADAAVHHHREPGGFGAVLGVLVPDAELHPQGGGAGRDGLLDDAGQELRPPEHVDEVDGLPDVRERRDHRLSMDALAQRCRVHGDDAVAGALQVRADAVARAPGLGARSDDRDGARALEDATQVLGRVAQVIDAGEAAHGVTRAAADPSA
jgi:hypothetical protein